MTRDALVDDAPETAQMTPAQFDVMAAKERTHWWFRAKRQYLQWAVGDRRPARALDVGCGTGATASALVSLGAATVGSDLSDYAIGHARRLETSASFLRTTAEKLPFADGSFDVVTMFDVLEHLDDDVAALQEIRRCLRPGGLLVLMVPAYQWAWSDHDVSLGHVRRYTAPRLDAAVARSGLRIEQITYLHSWLVPIALLVRKTPLGRLLGGTGSGATEGGRVGAALFSWLTRVEFAVMRRRRVPFGLTVAMVASKSPAD